MTRLIVSIGGWLGDIGTVWFWAWVLNPDLTSNNVWFIAVLVAGFAGPLARIEEASR